MFWCRSLVGIMIFRIASGLLRKLSPWVLSPALTPLRVRVSVLSPSRALGLRALSALDRSLENAIIRDSFPRIEYVIGCDEAGRGALAGPVVVAALACKPRSDGGLLLPGAADSKMLSETQREGLYEQIVRRPDAFAYNIAIVGPALIDEINILQATMVGMQIAINDLALDLGASSAPPSSFYAIVDGNKTPSKLSVPGRPMVKADKQCYSVALASILAKVTRDRLMCGEYHDKWPQYKFAAHKGYPTKEHVLLIHQHGPSPIHRLSFKPLKGRASP